MHPFLKWSLAAAAIVLALDFAVPGVIWLQSEAVIERRYPLPSTTLEPGAHTKPLARGAHLVQIAGCADCHGENLEGRLQRAGGVLPIWSSNLRRDAQGMSDEDFEHAIRSGIAPDAKSLWLMPSMDYAYLSEDDLAAIVAYLRTMKPEGPARPKPTFDMQARYAIANDDLEPITVRAEETPASLDLGPRYDGGRYLARIACSDCHGTDLAGAAEAPDLRLVGRYDRSAFFALLRQGRSSDGRLLAPMAKPRFRALFDYEIDALYDYLSARAKTLTRYSHNRP